MHLYFSPVMCTGRRGFGLCVIMVCSLGEMCPWRLFCSIVGCFAGVYMSVFPSICLSVCLCNFSSVGASVFMFIYRSAHLPVHLWSIYLSVHPSVCLVYLSFCQSVHPSIHQSIHPSIHPSIHLLVHVSVSLSIRLGSVHLSICLSFWKRLSITNILKQKKSDKTRVSKATTELQNWSNWSKNSGSQITDKCNLWNFLQKLLSNLRKFVFLRSSTSEHTEPSHFVISYS